MLFAQGVMGAWGPGPDDLVLILAFVGGLLLAYLAIAFLFLLTLSMALGKCRPHNRTIKPWQVWLNLIPCFNIVWQFVTVIRVADSLRNEFDDRGERTDDDFGRSIGLAAIILNMAASAISSVGDLLPRVNVNIIFNVSGLISTGIGIGAFACFIIYWIKIARYSRRLSEEPEYDERRYRNDRADRQNPGAQP